MKIILQESAQHEKNLMGDIASYIQYSSNSIRANMENKFLFLVRDGRMHIIHRKLNEHNFHQFPDFNTSIDIMELLTLLNTHGNIFWLSAEVEHNANNDQQLLCGSGLYYRSTTGEFQSAVTGEILAESKSKSTNLCFVAFFKTNILPIHIGILNTDVIRSTSKLVGSEQTTFSSRNMSIRDQIIHPGFSPGVVQIGKYDLFVPSDRLDVRLFTGMAAGTAKTIPNIRDLLSVESNVPYTTDGLTITCDLSGLNIGDTGYLRFSASLNEFMEKFIYRNQRPIWEYVIVRTG